MVTLHTAEHGTIFFVNTLLLYLCLLLLSFYFIDITKPKQLRLTRSVRYYVMRRQLHFC